MPLLRLAMLPVALLCTPGCNKEPIQEGCASCDGACSDDILPSSSRSHVEGGVLYTDTPPAGGDHDPCWAEWGVHTEAVEPANWIHNLEHGGVVFLYECPQGCPEEVDRLTTLVSSTQESVGLPGDDIILSPYSGGMASRFAVVAWEHRLVLDCIDEEAMLAWYTAHRNQAPESTTSMPPGSCMDDTGTD